MTQFTNRNPYESENDRFSQRLGQAERAWGERLNKGAMVSLMAMVGSALSPELSASTQLTQIYTVSAGLFITGLHYYLKSDAKLATENIMGRGIIEDILYQRGKELAGTFPGSKRLAGFFSKELLSAPRDFKRHLSNNAIVHQARGDLFTLMKRATETVNKDNLESIYQQYRTLDVNTLHLAVILGADQSQEAQTFKAHDAFSHPDVQRLFAEGKRLLPTLADHLPSTHAFLRHLRGALGDDVHYILKEPTNSLKAVKEFNTLGLNMIEAGAKQADIAYSYEVLKQHTVTLINHCQDNTLSLQTLMTCLNDIQSIKEAVTPRVLHEERQNQHTDQPTSQLRPLMEGCDRVLRKYRPLFKAAVDALPADLHKQLFQMKHQVDLTGFILSTPEGYTPKTWPADPQARIDKVTALLFKGKVDPILTDPRYAFMVGVEQCLEKAVLNNEYFYSGLNLGPRLPACKAIVERVLQRTLLSQIAQGDISNLSEQQKHELKHNTNQPASEIVPLKLEKAQRIR